MIRQMPSFVPPRGSFQRCKRCHEQFFWAQTGRKDKDGRIVRMPVDVAPASTGNLVIHQPGPGAEGNARMPFATVVRHLQAEGMREAGIRLYQNHLVDCPFAEEFRKQARSKGTWRRKR